MPEIDVQLPAQLGLAALAPEERNAVLQAVWTAARTQLGRPSSEGTSFERYRYVDVRTDLWRVRAYYSGEESSSSPETRLTLWHLDMHYVSPQ